MASWLFGKKKHKESTPDSPEEEPTQPDDEYIFIEKRNQPEPNPNGFPSNLYPSLVTPYPSVPVPPMISKQTSQDSQTNDLNNIPFKLSKELERSLNDDLVIDKLRLDEIVSFIKRVNMKNYDYEFSLERSVIAEMNSQNEE